MAEHASFDVVPFAVTNFRNGQQKFGIKLDDRRRHVYVIGKSGTGKSVLLENMIYTDIRAGHGLAVVDPHGDLVEKVLDLVPSHRVNDVVYFNPSDIDYPVAFNPLESVDPKYRHLVASGLVGVFKKIWADSWGPRLEYILRNAILSLLEYPSSTLLGITRILVDKYYRKKVLEKVTDPVVRSFWIDEYDNYNEKFRTEAISPIQNKIGQFLSSAIIRNIVGQPKSTIDLRQIMDEQKVLLMDLSKGRVGEDNSALLGAMMITKIQLAAMSRIDKAENERKDFFLYVDEFQNFATESFATILSEARKYRLNLIIAHQYIEQLGDVVRAAVFGNVGTMIVFRVGAEDAEFLEKEFAPTFTETDLVSLPNYHIYLKLMIDGVTSDAFSATTLPPVGVRNNNRSNIIKVSRERYAQDRQSVEEKILRWAGVEEVFRGTAQAESRSLNPEEAAYRESPRRTAGGRLNREPEEPPRLNLNQPQVELFEDACWVCGRKVQLPFKPDGIRPVYCKEDIKKIRQGLIPKPKPRLVVTESKPVEPAGLPTVGEPVQVPPSPITTVEPSAVPPSVAIEEPRPTPTLSADPILHLVDVLAQEVVPFEPANQPAESSQPMPWREDGSRSLKPQQVVRFSDE
ncbi:MAG: type IV secretion system DNA-binding domain-containing protein [Candidatus Veblenbacteria bacterium]|nr:type IV secretion system DNA-binding domain-containing protein [Candidatus Veblenbacteria bacterium]MDZ4229553.1 type IV secretion system DNA-binding domain-containing protein [Candidatus Veblenbacteria bacterium]